MSAQACTQLNFLHRADNHKMYNHAENKLCTQVRWGILKPIFVQKIGEIFKNRLIRLGLGALKSTRNTINVDNSGCHDSLMTFISFGGKMEEEK